MIEGIFKERSALLLRMRLVADSKPDWRYLCTSLTSPSKFGEITTNRARCQLPHFFSPIFRSYLILDATCLWASDRVTKSNNIKSWTTSHFTLKNPTRCNSVSKFYFTFIWSSTCFGRHNTHHQEPKTAISASGFAYVESCWPCSCWTLTASSNYTANSSPRM